MVVFLAIYIEEWDSIVMFLAKAGIIAFSLNIIMMIVGFYTAKFFASATEWAPSIIIISFLSSLFLILPLLRYW